MTTPPDFVHLHVHSQYSILDGQASIQKLVDKAMRDGQPGIALTDHGNMFGIKEFYNYVKKVKGKYKAQAAEAEARLAALVDGSQAPADPAEIARCRAELADLKRKAAFKPIIGSEVYVARRRMQDKEGKPDQSGYHLILLAKNLKGYHNLIKIVSKAWTEGFYMRPRTDRVELEKYHEGLICCSACLAGEVPRAITADDMQKAEEAILWHKKLFGDDYYLELQLHKATVERANHEAYPMQLKVNEHLRRLAAKHGVRLVCTNDVHFVDEDNAEAHDRLICLSTGKDLDDPKRMLYSKQEWLKTREEMAAIFGDVPEAMATTVEICEQVETYSIDHSPIMPTFEIPAEFGTEEGYRQRFSEKDLFDEFTQDENGNVVLSEEEARKKIEKLGGYDKLYRIKLEADYLRKLTMDGARKRYGEQLTDEQQERLNFELHIMKTMGFPGYFLIVQDFIRAAREELDVSVGRGLLPGDHADRPDRLRPAVRAFPESRPYLAARYRRRFRRRRPRSRAQLGDAEVRQGEGRPHHHLRYDGHQDGDQGRGARAEVVARGVRSPLQTGARQDSRQEAQPAAAESDNPVLRDTMRYAQMLEGNVRGTGVHACGTIICRDDITDWVPVSTADDKETGQKMLVTQYEGSVIEDTGLIKMDFLGLKTLSIIKDAVENIRLTTGRKIDIDDFSIIDDPATYKLFCEGRTVGTFQFESPGMQKYLRELQPSTFEDLIAMNALYRPGPMDYIPDFIARKHGRSPIVYVIPVMEKYLKDTYGVTVYQEQVMLLSRLLANFTRGESDTLRKAMGKKLKDKLDALKPKFIKGGQANGHDPKVLEKIWGDWEKFASYAFNKSHATCYSWVAFQTAYLKANYPSEYMAAVLSRNLTNVEQLTIYMNECKRMGINVLGPDINESMLQFSANKQGDVRFGLAAIKGVGEAAVESIIAERTKNGRFKDIYDFIERVDYSLVNRKCLENIAYAGGCDSISGFSRCKFFGVDQRDNNGVTYIEQLMRYGQRYQSEKNNAQQSLFGGDTGTTDITPPVIPACAEWSQLEKLNKEREVIGLYLSAHPLDDYKVIIRNMCKTQVGDLDHLDELKGKEIAVAGMVVAVQNLTTKTGKPWGKFKLEDYNGTHEFALFGKDYENFRKYLFSDYFLFIRGRVQPRPYNDQELEFRITSMMQLSELQEAVKEVHVQLAVEEITRDLIARMGRSVKEAKGNTLLRLNVYDRQAQVSLNLFSKSYKVSLTQGLVSFFEDNDIKYTVI